MDRSTGAGGKRWQWVGLALVVTGILLLVVSYLYQGSLMIDHIYFKLDGDGSPLGVYTLEAGDYTVWVEDPSPAVENTDFIFVYADNGVNPEEKGVNAADLTTRTIDGRECEEAGTFRNLSEGAWSFTLITNFNMSDDGYVHAYITRENVQGPAFIFGAGVVLLSLGLVTVGIVKWGRRQRTS